MSKRYAISGVNNIALDGTAALTGKYLMGEKNRANRKFFLRSVWCFNPTASVVLHLIDAASGVARDATDNAVVSIYGASGEFTKVDFPAPGLKFDTAPCIVKDVTDASGSFGVGLVGGQGYEE